MYEGRVTANVVDRFAPVTKNALQIVLRDIVRRSFAAVDQVVSTDPISPTPTQTPAINTGDAELIEVVDSATTLGRTKIVTTDRELECFALTKKLFDSSFSSRQIYDASLRREVPIEVAYKDTTGYFAVYLNKPSWWCIRVVMETRVPWVGFNVNPTLAATLIPATFTRLDPHPYAEFRVAIYEPSNLQNLSALVNAAFNKTIEDRRINGDTTL